jgi:hypothetical protein
MSIKYIKGSLVKRYLIILFTAFWISCEEDDHITYSENDQTSPVITNPYIQIVTPVVGFVAGKESYEYKFNIMTGVKSQAIKEVKVYSQYTDAETGSLSNEVLLQTIPVEDPIRTTAAGLLTYDDLKEGLTVNGGPLPASDLDLKVGSGWKFRFEGVKTNGDIVPLAGTINVAVLSPYAGIYKVKEAKYYRIGVLTADWTGETRFIGSVNETTFSHPDFWGQFAWTGAQFNFTIDFETNKVTDIPILTDDGLFSGTGEINCVDNPGAFANVPCDGSNVLIPDPVGGKHILKLTYGYTNSADGGMREFYEVLEKLP